jgi:hypothetical protein
VEVYEREITGLKGVSDLAVQGLSLYAVGTGEDALMRFNIDGNTGLIEQTQVIHDQQPVNIAVHGGAVQSSTYANGSQDASHAIDGNTNGNFNSATGAVTSNALEPWWRVDLGGSYDLGEIRIFNRTDGGWGSRLHHFTVRVYDGANVVYEQTEPGTAGDLYVISLPTGTVGDGIEIKLDDIGTKSDRYLQLAEVEVYQRPITGLDSVDLVEVSEDGGYVYAGFSSPGAPIQVFHPESGGLAYHGTAVPGSITLESPQLPVYSRDGRFGYRVSADTAGIEVFDASTSEVIQEVRNQATANLALAGTAGQSSTWPGGYDASNAIDGNTNGNYGSARGSHTLGELEPWWGVGLDGRYDLGEIRIFNRTDGGWGSRLHHFTVKVYDDANIVYTQTEPGTAGDLYVVSLPTGTVGDRVEVQLDNIGTTYDRVLQLAEVEVYRREITGLTGVSDLAVQGLNLYAAGTGEDALMRFNIDEGTGLIEQTQVIRDQQPVNIAVHGGAAQSSTYESGR